jgi:NADH:ubiquinone oxidoreductase subunit F (NADH-binding)
VNATLSPLAGRRAPTPDPRSARLFTGSTDLVAHQRHHGTLPPVDGRLVDLVGRAGLLGRGGAGFPTSRKVAAVAAGRGPRVVVANATEGEPLSSKDKALIARSPHLVLDGLTLAADALGASRRVLCLERGNPAVERALQRARGERGDERIEVVLTPRRYIAGQETALVDLIDGGVGKPTRRRPFERGVGGRPTLVDNVETLAQIALIARYGPEWYRGVGTDAEPGSALFSVAGEVERPAVYEVPFGYPVSELLGWAGTAEPRAVLLGGYFGRWLPGEAAMAARLSRASLAPLGADIGCGVIVAFGHDICAVDEVARVAGWFAANSAGQCGSCTWGLRDLALATQRANVGGGPSDVTDIARWSAMVKGRGGCRLPDGAASFLESALIVFADEIEEHRAGRCRRRRAHLLPTPDPEPWA